MAYFPRFLTTEVGKRLFLKVLNGQTMNFTRMSVGVGELPPGESFSDRASLVDSLDWVSITGRTERLPDTLALEGPFLNTGLTDGLWLKEMGVHADDPDEGEILYAYTNAGDMASWIPPEAEGVFTHLLEANIIVANLANITVTLDPAGIVTRVMLDEANSWIQMDGAAGFDKWLAKQGG